MHPRHVQARQQLVCAAVAEAGETQLLQRFGPRLADRPTLNPARGPFIAQPNLRMSPHAQPSWGKPFGLKKVQGQHPCFDGGGSALCSCFFFGGGKAIRTDTRCTKEPRINIILLKKAGTP